MGVTITSAQPVVGGDKDVWGVKVDAFLQELVTKLGALAKADVGLSNVPNADLSDRGAGTYHGTQPSTTISGLTEAVQDLVAAFVVAGSGISVAYDDTAGTLTIAAATTLSPVEINWDGTGSCPARSVATSNPAQPVYWNTPTISTPPTAGGLYALENDKWYYGA